MATFHIDPRGNDKPPLIVEAERTTTITGRAAIEYARGHGLTLSKYTDPTEEAREGLSIAEAEDVAREDPGLIYIAADFAEAAADRKLVYVVVNMDDMDSLSAPAIYRQYEDGRDASGTRPWDEIHRNWQGRDGSSVSGDRARDAMECRAEVERLRAEGHAVYVYS